MSKCASKAHEREPLPLGLAGWFLSAGVFGFGAWGYLSNGFSAGPAFLIALAVIMQVVGALGVRSIKRSKELDLEGSRRASIGLACAGGAFNAYTLHHAFEQTGMFVGSFETAALAWLVSFGVAFCDLASWWIDESLRSEAHERKSADEDARVAEATARDVRPFAWGDLLALDNAGLDVLASVDAETFAAVRSKLASANTKASHASKKFSSG